jgi:hypothetical protein
MARRFPGGKQLWDYIKKFNVIIASTPSRSNASRIGKKKWCERELDNTELILTSKKEDYADENSILIDDKEKNIMK